MPRKKKNEECIPFVMMSKFSKTYPGIYEKADEIVKFANGKVKSWDKRCFLPYELAIYLMKKYMSVEDLMVTGSTDLLQALYSWKQYKEIFTIDKDFGEELIHTKIDENDSIPIELFDLLPYPSFYVDFNDWKIDQITGFYFYFDNNLIESDKRILGIEVVLMNEEGPLRVIPFILEEGVTIRSSYEYYSQFNKRARKNKEFNELYGEFDENDVKTDINFLSNILSIIFYICSANAEIEENPKQKVIYRKSSVKNDNKFSGVQKWDVGVRTGSAIRKYKNTQDTQEYSESETIHRISGNSSVKRPHCRKAHFHRYWVGSGDERRLELRWLSPIFVNCENNTDGDIIIRKIE